MRWGILPAITGHKTAQLALVSDLDSDTEKGTHFVCHLKFDGMPGPLAL